MSYVSFHVEMTEKHHYGGNNVVFHLITDTENPGVDLTNPGIGTPRFNR